VQYNYINTVLTVLLKTGEDVLTQ